MEFMELAKKRYSVRNYENKAVEPEKLQLVLEAGRIAPTACNNQPYKIIVAGTSEDIKKLQKGYPNTYGAPIALIVCSNHDQSWKRSFDQKDAADIDASIVTTHMMLCATELGLGSVWLCAFNPEAIREQFNIFDPFEPVNILLLGYAADKPASPGRHSLRRKSLDDTVVYGAL